MYWIVSFFLSFLIYLSALFIFGKYVKTSVLACLYVYIVFCTAVSFLILSYFY